MKALAWLLGGLLAAVSTSALSDDKERAPHPNELMLISQDGKDVGLNDPTPAIPIGGNFGTTVGDQRRIAYQFTMDLWAAVLRTPVGIYVEASFQPLQCDHDADLAGKDVLGQAYAIRRITTKRGSPGLYYQLALANVIDDVQPNKNGKEIHKTNEIHSEFNSVLGGENEDKTTCAKGGGWYYGLDGKTPEGQTNFVNVVTHEIAHGLGFSGDSDSGGDIYSKFAYDNVSGKNWNDLSDNKHGWSHLNDLRKAAKTGQNVVFRGPHVHAEVPLVLGPRLVVRFSGAIQRDVMRYTTAVFGPPIKPGTFVGPLAFVDDGAGDDHQDACEPLVPGSLVGRVAFVNRGICDLEVKAKNAQDAGAIAIVIGNVATSTDPEDTNFVMAHTKDALVRANIPSVLLSLTDANAVRNAPKGDITAQTTNVVHRFEGADDNDDPYLYTPPTASGGSTFSHFDSLASPDLVMEPASSAEEAAHVNLDLTPALLADEGWILNPGNGMIGTCDTGVRAVVPGGKIIGANIQAYSAACVSAANGSRSKYLRCMTDHATELKNAKLIDNAQFAQIRSCAARVEPVAKP